MNRGRWGGILTTLVISKLMGCSYYIAAKRLQALEKASEETVREVDLEDIGKLIYEYRRERIELEEANVLDRYFFNPVIRM